MTDLRRLPGEAGPQPTTSEGPSLGRRRALRAGIAVTPVVMTVASRPVLGAAACQSPSGMLSGNLSHPATGGVCAGRTPGYWKNYNVGPGHPWPAPYYPVDNYTATGQVATVFCNVFVTATCRYPGSTFLDVLKQGGGGLDALARHIVAALLNASTDPPIVPIEILPVATIKAMWQQCVTNGCYSVNATVCWNPDQVTTYLQSTQTV